MCGIAGIFDLNQATSDATLAHQVVKMADALQNRGPDDSGFWTDEKSGIALAQKRLSIIDLSQAGHQPMTSANGRYVIVYNGEIYNHRLLRQELEQSGLRFKGHSDTETLLEALACWGMEKTLKKLIGMFAFALWDKQEKILFFARDRIGIKPFYWGKTGQTVYFASQPGAFRQLDAFDATIDNNSLAAFMRLGYVPPDRCIYQNTQQLPPGNWLSIDRHGKIKTACYWDITTIANTPRNGNITPDEAVDQLETLLSDAISLRTIADVPLGAFLSGGVDSSTVVALLQEISKKPVKTFSIGFGEKHYNEAIYAAEVARHLGTDHTEMYVTAEEALAVIPDLPTFYDEPFADSSQIPTYLVSKLARQHVTVALSGDGGDECFAGYNRYAMAKSLKRAFQPGMGLARLIGGTAMTGLKPSTWNSIFKALPVAGLPSMPGDKMAKLAGVLRQSSFDKVYGKLVSQWSPDLDVVPGHHFVHSTIDQPFKNPALDDIAAMQLADMLTYLPGDILTKVDRASMAVSLEARVPILDHRVIEYSWQLPTSIKIKDGITKWPLRQILYKRVPRHLIERPKMGFAIPLDQWLRSSLRDWAESLLSKDALDNSGLLNTPLIRRHWEEHLSGHRNWQYALWCVLVFQAWRQHNR